MTKINWGIIGCGDVTEVKSGPAFNKVDNSALVAVMRRDAAKAEDYAKRHEVPKWYSNADELINDPEVNAIYVATPPLQHEEYTIAAFKSGKPVYVEKPMSVDAASAQRMVDASKQYGQKLCVAHYRHAQPRFIKLKELLNEGTIGDIRFVNLRYLQPALTATDLQDPGRKWRVDPKIAGGGLFHDLAPHQIDLMTYLFGTIKTASGISANQAAAYAADDIVSGQILFENNVLFNGLWCFAAPAEEASDICEIVGSEGKISFNVFTSHKIFITKKGKTSTVIFEELEHVQQPMIDKVVQYFLNKIENPSLGENGVDIMQVIDRFTSK